MLAILVTGSRKWTDITSIIRAICSELGTGSGRVVLLHGDAPGADTLAGEVGHDIGLSVVPFPAQWEEHGRAAGPIRNDVMVDVLQGFRACGYRCVVLAFPLPGSVGTLHCMEAARRYGFEVKVFEPTSEAKR